MMTLVDAAEFFDDNVFTDTYGSATFQGQFLPFSDSVRSGAATKRRILEVGSGISLPTKRTVTAPSGIKYLIASANEDLFQGEVIRVKYPVLPVYDQYITGSIGQILANALTVDAYMHPSYIRRNILDDQSEYSGAYDVYHSSYYTVSQGDIIFGAGKYFRAKDNSHIDDVGFGVVEAVELNSPLSTLTYVAKGVYNPVTDTSADTTITGVSSFIEHITLDFQHEALGYVDLKLGDRAISFLKSKVTTAKVGDTVGKYNVIAVDDNSTFWTVHARV